MARISKKKFKEAVSGSGGVQSVVAQKMGVTRQSICIYLKKHPDLKAFLDQEGEKIIDVAENILDSSITKDRDIDSAKWKLSNSKRGKARGYGSKQELEHIGTIFNIKREIVNSKEGKNEGSNNPTETKP